MTNKSVISALLGIALMAMPVSAAARSKAPARFNRGPAPAFHPAPARFRPASAPRFAPVRPARPAAFRPVPPAHFAPRYNPPRFNAPVNHWAVAPVAPIRNHAGAWQPPPANPGWVPPGHRRADYAWYPRNSEPDRDDYDHDYWEHHHRYGYEPERGYYGNYDAQSYGCDEDGDNCGGNTYYDGGYGDTYGSNSQYYSPMPGTNGYLSHLIYARDMAMMKYRRALARGDHKAAKHLYNAVKALNRRIAAADHRFGRSAYNYASPVSPYAYSGLGAYTAPYANSYGYSPYGNGYGSPALSTIVGPLLQNFVP